MGVCEIPGLESFRPSGDGRLDDSAILTQLIVRQRVIHQTLVGSADDPQHLAGLSHWAGAQGRRDGASGSLALHRLHLCLCHYRCVHPARHTFKRVLVGSISPAGALSETGEGQTPFVGGFAHRTVHPLQIHRSLPMDRFPRLSVMPRPKEVKKSIFIYLDIHHHPLLSAHSDLELPKRFHQLQVSW